MFCLCFFLGGKKEAKLGDKRNGGTDLFVEKNQVVGERVFLSGHDFGGSVLWMCYIEIIEFQIRKLEKLQEERCSPLSRRIEISVG